MLTRDNLRLRAVEPSDIDLLYTWENDPSIWHVSNTLAPYSRYQIEQYVLNAENDLFASRQVRFMIEVTEENGIPAVIGSIDLFEIDPLHRRAGIGILVMDPFRNKGYASRALELIIEYAAEKLFLHQLYCQISDDNTLSHKLFEKFGFTRCGTRREWLASPAGWVDEHIYQLILDGFTNRA